MRQFIAGVIIGAVAGEFIRRVIRSNTLAQHRRSRVKLRFAKELVNDRDALIHGFHQIELRLAGIPSTSAEDDRKTADELEMLRIKFRQHFKTEEEGGRFADLVEAFPHMAGFVDHLERHRNALVDQLRDICTLAENGGSAANSADLRERLNKFNTRLREHERRECDLFLEAYSTDIGPGD